MVDYSEFIDEKNVIAVVGVSPNKEKFGYKVYNTIREKGFKVYGVNPRYAEVDEDKLYPDLESLPGKPDVVVTVVPPKVTEWIVRSCNDLGINKVWMQPGSQSEEALKFCKEHGIEAIDDACFIHNGLRTDFV